MNTQVPRIAEGRPPAEPSSPEQRARYRRIVRAAAELGAENGLERVQMHEVAKNADVAIGTLYRYFPSKIHLFAGVMADQVDRLYEDSVTPGPADDADAMVVDLLVGASKQLMRRPLLATAMMQAVNSAHPGTVADAAKIDTTFRDLILRTLGIEHPTAQDATLVRLLMQCWYGVLTSSLNGRLSLPEAESDIRTACRLLLASRSV